MTDEPITPEEHEELWRAELLSRAKRVIDGEDEGEPWELVRDRLRARLGRLGDLR